MSKKTVLIILLLITLLGGFFRFYFLEKSPPSLNFDEASLGYNAYSLLKTGRDEYGNFLPVSLRSFDDYKPALYSYLDIVPLAVFGLNDFAVRIPSALAGSFSILLVALIGLRVFKNPLVSIFAAILISFEPWSLHFSRVAFESNLASMFFLAGVWLFFESLKRPKILVLSLAGFILSMFAYHSERAIALPTFFLFILIALRQKELKLDLNKIFLLAFLSALFLLPLILELKDGLILNRLGNMRLTKLWPFIPLEFVNQNSPFLSFPVNPVYGFLWEFFGRIFAYFSPMNLFIRGTQESVQFTPTLGMFNLIEFPFWLIGIISLFRIQKYRLYFFIWAILSIIPGVITWTWFTAVRTLTLYPLYSLTIAYGLFISGRFLWSKSKFIALPATGFTASLFLVSFVYLINTEIVYAPKITYGEYQPGFKEATPVLVSLQDSYAKVVIESPHAQVPIFLLYYQAFPPELIQKEHNYSTYANFEPEIKFSKYEFRKIYWPKDKFMKNTLFWGSVFSLPERDISQDPNVSIIKDVKGFGGYTSVRIVGTK